MRDGQRRGVIVVTIIVVIAFLLILATVFMGIKSVGKILIFLIGALLVLSILGVIFWAVWYLFFKKQKFDATYQNKKRLITASKISLPESIGDLYLTGDKAHSRVRLGKIIGYCRIKVMKSVTQYDDSGEPTMKTDKNGKRYEVFDLDSEEQDVFVVQKHGFFMSLFVEPMVVRVSPRDHDSLVGDVNLYGFSILPVSEYWYLHTDYLKVDVLDKNVLREGKRTVAFEMLKDFKEITDKAIGLDSSHKKDLENKNLVEIPQSSVYNGGGGRP